MTITAVEERLATLEANQNNIANDVSELKADVKADGANTLDFSLEAD